MYVFSQEEKVQLTNHVVLFLLPTGCIKHFRRGIEIEVKRGKEICKMTPEMDAKRQFCRDLEKPSNSHFVNFEKNEENCLKLCPGWD